MWPILLILLAPSPSFTLGKRPQEYDFGCVKVVAASAPGKKQPAPEIIRASDHKVDNKTFTSSSKIRSRKNKAVFSWASQGSVLSSGYPHNGYSSQKCSLELEAPIGAGLVLHVAFTDVDLEPRYSRSGQCLRDYLVLTIIDRDGREHTSERICGTERPEPVRSMQSRARLFFVASASTSNWTTLKRRRGFKLSYEFVPEATILAPRSLYLDSDRRFRAECGGVNSPTALSGEIQSPGFPFTYPRNVTCYWLLRVAPHRRLYIRLLDLELAPTVAECNRASLHLLDGYRHDLLPTTYNQWRNQSSQQQQQSPAATASSAAGGSSDGNSDGNGGDVGDGEDDSWATAIVSAMGSRRKATRRGDAGAEADAHFCGSGAYFADEGAKSLLSEGNRVVVKFTTSQDGPSQEQLARYQEKRVPIGFRLLWTEVVATVGGDAPLVEEDEPKYGAAAVDADPWLINGGGGGGIRADQCPGFVCAGGSFCMDSSLDSVCVDRVRLCVNETLRCDGVENCAENDGSDEEYCYSQNPVSLSALALVLVALIMLLLLLTVCLLRRMNKPKGSSSSSGIGRLMARSRMLDDAELIDDDCGTGEKSARRRKSKSGKSGEEKMGERAADQESGSKRRRRLSDTRMRRLQMPSISALVDQQQQQHQQQQQQPMGVSTNVIPATPPTLLLLQENGCSNMWQQQPRNLLMNGGEGGGGILIRDLDFEVPQLAQEEEFILHQTINSNNNIAAAAISELPCLCPIQQPATAATEKKKMKMNAPVAHGPPKVRVLSRENLHHQQHIWADEDDNDEDEDVWERRGSASAAAAAAAVNSHQQNMLDSQRTAKRILASLS